MARSPVRDTARQRCRVRGWADTRRTVWWDGMGGVGERQRARNGAAAKLNFTLLRVYTYIHVGPPRACMCIPHELVRCLDASTGDLYR